MQSLLTHCNNLIYRMKPLLISLLALVLCCTSVSAQLSKRQMIKKINSVYELLDQYYVEDVPLEPLAEEAIRATLRSLDPHSKYYTREEMQALKRHLKGEDNQRRPIEAHRVDSVGYIKISTFTKSIASEFYTAYKELGDVKSIVVDLRDNEGGYVTGAIDLTSLFLSKGDVIMIRVSKGRERVFDCKRDGVLRDIPLVVVINENTASASETFAGAIQDHDRGVIVGRTSYGKGLIQKYIENRDGSGILLTTAYEKTPSGRPIQRPYTMGDGDAYRSDSTRYMHPDSLHRDTSLKYKTLKLGREVYACGGITPDIYIVADDPTSTEEFDNTTQRAISIAQGSEYGLSILEE